MSVIRTYRAATVREALALVRAELGDDALILGQREIRRRPFPWRRVKVQAELTAAIATGTFRQAATTVEARPAIAPASRPASAAANSIAGRVDQGSPINPLDPDRPARIVEPTPDDPFHLYTQLIEQDVDETVARVLVAELKSTPSTSAHRRTSLSERCRELLARSVPCGGSIQVTPGRRRIVALVGPTGVGKTTTIAKLAASFRLRDRLRVGLITLDTYRVAAVEQLRTYAELIDVPMHVVTSPREMPAALDELTDMDLVLIDTAGRSPGDDLRIQELRSFLQAARADEVHLVASLTTGLPNFALTVERFSRVGPTALLLTKLDEAAGPGAVVSAAWEADLPLSYITTGQDVPDDIETAESERIALRVLPSGVEAAAGEVDSQHGTWPRRSKLRVA